MQSLQSSPLESAQVYSEMQKASVTRCCCQRRGHARPASKCDMAPSHWGGTRSGNIYSSRSSVSSPLWAWGLNTKKQFRFLITLGERGRKCFSPLSSPSLQMTLSVVQGTHLSVRESVASTCANWKAWGQRVKSPPKSSILCKNSTKATSLSVGRNSPLAEWEGILRLWNRNYKSQLLFLGPGTPWSLPTETHCHT